MATSKSTAASKKQSTSNALRGESPVKTRRKRLSLPCTIDLFFNYCALAWVYAKEYRLRLAEKRALYTLEFIEAQQQYVKVVKELPTLKARLNAVTNAHSQLMADNQAVRSLLQLLKQYILFAFTDKALAEAQLRAAGLSDYSTKLNNWPNTDSMIRNAKQYMANHAVRLGEGSNMPEAFPEEFDLAADLFYAAWSDFIAKKKVSEDGTATQEDGIENLLQKMNPMLDLAQRVFEHEPEERSKFTRSHLLNEVRSRHHAGIQGTVKLASTGKPQEGVMVEIEGVENAFAITNKRGRFSINVPGGTTYQVRFNSSGTEPLTLSKTTKPGVKGELKATLTPVPVLPEIAEVPNLDDTLSTALKDIKEKPKSNGQKVEA